MYNKMLDGERLIPEQRKDFLMSARGLVESQRSNLNALNKQYSAIARRNNLLPEDVVFDPFESLNLSQSTPPLPSAVSYSDPLKQAAWEAYKRNQVGSGVRQ
jgi:hypothetical protein